MNAATRLVQLWNPEMGYDVQMRDLAKRLLERGADKRGTTAYISATLREKYCGLVDETAPELSVLTDLLNNALLQVDWDELARIYVEEGEKE